MPCKAMAHFTKLLNVWHILVECFTLVLFHAQPPSICTYLLVVHFWTVADKYMIYLHSSSSFISKTRQEPGVFSHSLILSFIHILFFWSFHVDTFHCHCKMLFTQSRLWAPLWSNSPPGPLHWVTRSFCDFWISRVTRNRTLCTL